MTDDLAELKAKLDALNGDALAKAERKALKAVGDFVLAAIVEQIDDRLTQDYEGGSLEPGELAAGYKVRVHIAADESTVTGDTSRVSIVPTGKVVVVANSLESGHINRPGSKNPNTPAHPFVRPAFDAVEQDAIALYQSVMADEIRKYLDA